MNDFADHCVELLGSIGPARARRMFGGHGLYVDDLFVALIVADRLYLKVDDTTRPAFLAEACEPFVYVAKDDRRVGMNYYSAPEGAIESPPQMQPWAQLALGAALRARAAKAASTRRKPPPSRPKAAATKSSKASPKPGKRG